MSHHDNQHDIFRLTFAELERQKAEREKTGRPEPPAARILRESFAKREQQAQGREELRMSHDDILINALILAKEIIDELDSLMRPLILLSAEQFNERATAASRILQKVYDSSENNDVDAVVSFQLSRIAELAGETRIFPEYELFLKQAREYKEDAVERSKAGERINLADYEKDLADFLKRHPNVKRL